MVLIFLTFFTSRLWNTKLASIFYFWHLLTWCPICQQCIYHPLSVETCSKHAPRKDKNIWILYTSVFVDICRHFPPQGCWKIDHPCQTQRLKKSWRTTPCCSPWRWGHAWRCLCNACVRKDRRTHGDESGGTAGRRGSGYGCIIYPSSRYNGEPVGATTWVYQMVGCTEIHDQMGMVQVIPS